MEGVKGDQVGAEGMEDGGEGEAVAEGLAEVLHPDAPVAPRHRLRPPQQVQPWPRLLQSTRLVRLLNALPS